MATEQHNDQTTTTKYLTWERFTVDTPAGFYWHRSSADGKIKLILWRGLRVRDAVSDSVIALYSGEVLPVKDFSHYSIPDA